MTSFNERVIEEFRANRGRVEQFGDSLVLLHTIGSRSGAERINPVASYRDGVTWRVIASAAGAPKDPAWAHNLRAHPAIAMETAGGTVDVVAHELDGEEWATAWSRFTAMSPAFEGYTARAEGRRFPIFELAPAG